MKKYAALVASLFLALMCCFQLLLAAGLPLGRAAWGGQYEVLPMQLRFGSLAAVGILGAAIWLIRARAGLARPGAKPVGIRVATWVFACFLILNTLGNLASRSPVERSVMTPTSLLVALCFVIVALPGRGGNAQP